VAIFLLESENGCRIFSEGQNRLQVFFWSEAKKEEIV